jgi:uncharacterized membrane protein YesL
VTPVLLALLAVVDAAFAGFRAAAGRNARIFKRDYYRKSLLRGALAGLLLVVLLGILTLLVLALSADAAQQYAELLVVGERMLWVFVPYAVLVLTALVVYAVFDYDVRALATVAILGPFTLARPWVIALGCLVGLYAQAGLWTSLLTVTSSGAVVLLSKALDRRGRV